MVHSFFMGIVIVFVFLAAATLQGYSAFLFFHIFFRSKRSLWSTVAILGILLIAKSLVTAHLPLIVNVLVFCFIHYLIASLIFYGGSAPKLFFSILYSIFVFCVELCIAYGFRWIDSYSAAFIDEAGSMLLWFCQVLVVLLCTLFLVRKLYIFRNDGPVTLTNRIWTTLLIIPGSLFLILLNNSSRFEITMDNRYTVEGSYIYVVVCILILNVSILFLYKKLVENANESARNNLIETKMSEYETMLKHQKKLDHLRHDLRNILITVRGYVSVNQGEEALQYLNTILNDYFVSGKPISGHVVIDSICAVKFREAEDKGVEVRQNIIVPQDLGFQDRELHLSLILGNLLDNSIEGVLRLPEAEEKWIGVDMKFYQHHLVIIVENPAVIPENRKFLSSKRNYAERGTGMEIIETLTKNMEGTVTFHYTPPIMKAIVILPE